MCGCVQAFSRCGEQCTGFSLRWLLLINGTGLWSVRASVVVAQGRLSLLHWQVDSQPLGHQSRPLLRIFLFESHKLSKSKTRFNNLFLNWLSLLFPYSLVVFSNFDLSINGFHCFRVERYSFSLRCFTVLLQSTVLTLSLVS